MSSRFPMLGFDPAPGDPDAVARTASRLRQVADQLGHQAGELQRAGAVTASWRGTAACLYAGQVGERVVQLRTAAEVLGDLSQRLQRYARDLRGLQEMASRLERAAVPASTMVCLPGPATELEALRARARDLQEQAEHATRYVTAEVRRAAEASPAARRFDGWSDNPFGIPVGRWVAKHEEAFDLVGRVAGGAGLVIGGAAGVAALPFVAVPATVVGVLAVAGGAVGGVGLVSHAASAQYGDGAWKAVALDVLGLTAAGTAVPVVKRSAPGLARAGERVGHALTGWGAQDAARARLRGESASASPAARTTTGPALRQPHTPETRRIDATLRAGHRRELEQVLVRG